MQRYAFCFVLLCLVASSGVAGLGSSSPARAANEQVQNAADALQEALITWVSRGHATRGAEGILGELAVNSGDLACQTAVIDIRLQIRDMIIENGHLSGEQQTEHLQLIDHAQDFAALLEQECAKAGFLGETADGSGGTPGGGDGGDSSSAPAPRPAGTPIERRPGETVADAICRQRCQHQFNRLYDRQRWLDEAAEIKRAAEERVAAARARIPELNQALQAAQQELDRLNSIIRVAYNGSWSQARRAQWREAEAQSHVALGRVEDARTSLAAGEADLANAEAALRNEEGNLANHQRMTEDARRAYEDCLRRCLQQAADARDPTNTVCPAPAAHKSVSIGPNDKVGSRAQLGTDIKKSLGGGAGLGGLLGGSSGGTFGSKKANPVPNRASGGKEPETADDPIDDGDKVAQEVGDTELEVGARLVSDGLLVSSHIDDAPGDGTFQAVFLEDAYGRRMTPDRYDIYDLWREWTLTVWWTYDRWVDGQHVEHQEGGWSESERETMQLAALRPGEAAENGIWSRLGFSAATKGVRSLGTHFALTPEDLAQPVDLVIHTTLPEQDPVTTQPVIYRLSLENGGEVRLEPVTASLATARDCY